MVGDAINPPTLKATAALTGIGLLDSDLYIPDAFGNQWYQNQNNFYRQVRNFVIDLTAAPKDASGMHWQVAQATSLQNIKFVMRPKNEPDNKQQGVSFALQRSTHALSGWLTTPRSSWKMAVVGL